MSSLQVKRLWKKYHALEQEIGTIIVFVEDQLSTAFAYSSSEKVAMRRAAYELLKLDGYLAASISTLNRLEKYGERTGHISQHLQLHQQAAKEGILLGENNF